MRQIVWFEGVQVFMVTALTLTLNLTLTLAIKTGVGPNATTAGGNSQV